MNPSLIELLTGHVFVLDSIKGVTPLVNSSFTVIGVGYTVKVDIDLSLESIRQAGIACPTDEELGNDNLKFLKGQYVSGSTLNEALLTRVGDARKLYAQRVYNDLKTKLAWHVK